MGYPRWLLWFGTIFINVMVVGGLSLLLFVGSCYLFADEDTKEHSIYVKEIEINERSGIRTGYVVSFEDGLEERLGSAAKEDWLQSSYQTIKVRNTIFGIMIYTK